MDKYIVNMYCGGREIGVGDPFHFEQRKGSLRRCNPLKNGYTEVQTPVSVVVTEAN